MVEKISKKDEEWRATPSPRGAPPGHIFIALPGAPPPPETGTPHPRDVLPVSRKFFGALPNRVPATNELVGELATAFDRTAAIDDARPAWRRRFIFTAEAGMIALVDGVPAAEGEGAVQAGARPVAAPEAPGGDFPLSPPL